MKVPKRIGYSVGIALILMMLFYIFLVKAISEDKPQIAAKLLLLILFIFSAYWRLFQYYKLMKSKNRTHEGDFVGFFNNLGIIRLAVHCLAPFPVFGKLSNHIENKTRIQINIWTSLLWASFLLFLCLGFI